MSRPSKIFVSYRALGFVSNHVPLSLRYINRRNENLVVTVVGKSFHTYGCTKLNLLSVSGQHPEEISCMTSDAYLVFTSCKKVIYAWRRGNELWHTYKDDISDVFLMLPFGPHLITVYENNHLVLWDIKTEECILRIPFGKDTRISAIVHPNTYLNKILLGFQNGKLLLWNLKSNACVYTFPGWNSPVTVLEQAPAIDVVAIGLESGDIYLHNLKFDETIMKLTQDWGAITAISFRTDGQPIMASASPMGHIAVWDLEKRRLHSEIRDAHRGCVSGMKFLPNEPLLITSSSDNSIKMWIFDLPDEGARLLRFRDGHSSPPTKIQFYGADGRHILSAGLDSSLRSFSTQAEGLNKSLGLASFNRKAAKKKGVRHDPNKMLPVVDFASESTREKDWDSIAAIHRHSKIVTTWSYDRSCMGAHKPLHERFKGMKQVEALCLTISTCGNFVLIGYNTGHIDKFNIQSGIYRGSFGKTTAHEKSVRGIALDGFNQLVISGSADKMLKFWKFKDHSFLSGINLQQSVAKIVVHRDSAMVAVGLDDFSIVIIDIETRKIIRRFEELSGSITDMTFSPDSRWFVVASSDSSIKTWDIPSGRLIDWFLVSPICVSLALSPTSEYLATAHAGDLGIYLWANSTLYMTVSLHPLPDNYDPLQFDLPLITLQGKEETDDEMDDNMEVDENIPEFKSPKQISDELVTLSLLPQSKWLNLLDLDVIKRRNKPKEPVQVPKNAPFFLPVVSGLNPTFMIDDKDKKESGSSKVLHVVQHKSEFAALLEKADSVEKYEEVFSKLKELSPSNVDVEIRCLSPENGGSIHLMETFLRMINAIMKLKTDFEVVNSYSSLFLQIHYETASQVESLREILKEISESLKVWESLQEKMNYILCVGKYAMGVVF